MNDQSNTLNAELRHYGVKGMKWGVRRYYDKNGRLTPEGKARALASRRGMRQQSRYAYRSMGASRSLANRHAYYDGRSLGNIKKAEAAAKRLRDNEYGAKDHKRLAKDYATAINGMRTIEANKKQELMMDYREVDRLDRKIAKLQWNKPSERGRKKLAKLLNDRELMALNISDLYDEIDSGRYKNAVDGLLKSMSGDGRVVYSTKNRLIAATGASGNSNFETWGTKYNVKAATKSRSKRKKYTDPKHKREYEDENIERIYQYYY